jgi:2,4'-dihydroxyacetophenone dioxygenase
MEKPDIGIDFDAPLRTHAIWSSSYSTATWVHDPRSGSEYALLQVDRLSGLWVTRTRFAPGSTVQAHLHSGPVVAITLEGEWCYPEMHGTCRKGDYLVELAGAVHTLQVVGDDWADIIFSIMGSVTYFDDQGGVEAIEDWLTVFNEYKQACLMKGVEPEIFGAP